ncbi:FadR/GntR family transcriptional regulator [Fictibacillus phosphorivorans]|uniref:FadR/GntR family transcriptional regulator n=1 Tax=Fictibacillus phosphorivorans TaxID=1221500 RepID=UPI00203B0036|nr:GntR family transcriptional regulator [Fictibacillus phosphorivorans]MCM3717922.1 GntR family transcriptional regulator [Fictibacillus phosphorivorans]MCM3775371.1 GntR family transcriptional regulator [Fictibacillus phosphorivorans]
MSVQPTEKVYIEILKKIQAIIVEDRLQAGDKLPSERELSDRLNAGRSSVREALRALELLGLIETRRGEGTFICEASGHRLVEVLASFILNDKKARRDLQETRDIVIKDCMELATKRITSIELRNLEELTQKMEDDSQEIKNLCKAFEKTVILSCGNHLLYRLYVELTGYGSSLQETDSFWPPKFCKEVLALLTNKDAMKLTDLLSKQNDALNAIE